MIVILKVLFLQYTELDCETGAQKKVLAFRQSCLSVFNSSALSVSVLSDWLSFSSGWLMCIPSTPLHVNIDFRIICVYVVKSPWERIRLFTRV